jgi:hypothetical protein
MALIGSGVVLVALVVAVVMYYRGGVRGADGAPPAVGQPVATVKTPPAASAKDDDPFSNLDVYAAQNVPSSKDADAKPTFAPAPEQPAARPAPGLKVQTVDANAVHAAPTTPVATTQLAPPQAAAPNAAAPAHAAPSAAAPAPPSTAVAAQVPAKPVAAPARDTAAPATPAVAGPASVQIGAYSSEALADKGYREVASAFPTFMDGKAKHVEQLDRDGKTLFRTSVAGFASRSSAAAFCAALKASGHVCLVKG